MAITRAQQAKQMLQDGGMLVQPSMTGKRPGYRGDAAYGKDSRSQQATSIGQAQGATGKGGGASLGDGPASKGFDQNAAPGEQLPEVYGASGKQYDPAEALATAKAQGAFDKPNFFESLLTARRKPIYNIFPNNPKIELQFISRLKNFNPEIYNRLPKNIRDLYEETIAYDEDRSFKDFDKFSFEDFEALSKFQTGLDTPGLANFADYAATYGGAPGLKFSGNVGNKEKYVTGKDPITGETMYGYREKTGDDGPSGESDLERRLRLLEEQNAALKNQQNDEDLASGMAFRFMNRGGMPMDAPTTGGIMDLETGRQMYFLGKLVKKATRAVKKVAKSPIGKVALLAGLNFAPTLFNKGTVLQGLGGMFSKKGLSDFFFAGKDMALKNLTGKGALAGIGALSALPFLFQGDEDDEDQTMDRGPGIDIDYIRNNPYTFIPRRFAAEGGSMKEPVAKKTMPLLDMGGKEMDFREEGGFVPIGRMERADDVPARLSKNEFVFTADAVRNAGDGNIDKGAEVMYNMMKNLESGGEVSEESQGLEGAREMFQTSKRLEEVL